MLARIGHGLEAGLMERLEDAGPAAPIADMFGSGGGEVERVPRAVRSLGNGIGALAELRGSELDMALGFFFRPGNDIETSELYRESYSVVMRKGHGLAKKKLTTKRYADAQHLLMSPLGELHGIVDASLARHRLERNVAGSVPLFLLVLATVAKTDLISTIPSRLAQSYGKAFGLSIAPPPIDIRPFPIHLAWHQRSSSEPALKWFRELTRSVIVDVAADATAWKGGANGVKPRMSAGA
jgi:DNA-binding transcriptional LysR family regulator